MTLHDLINDSLYIQEELGTSVIPLFINGTSIDKVNLTLKVDCEGRYWVDMTFNSHKDG